MARQGWKKDFMSLPVKVGMTHSNFNWKNDKSDPDNPVFFREPGRRLAADLKEKIRLELMHHIPVRQISMKFKVSYKAVHDILTEMPDEQAAYRARANERMIDDLRELVGCIIDSILPSDIQEANLRDKALAVSVLVEKMRLISGESTENIGSYVTDRELIILATKTGVDLPPEIRKRIEPFIRELDASEGLRKENQKLPKPE